MTVREEIEERQKKDSVERSHTQRETWTSWLGMDKGGTGRWAQDEDLDWLMGTKAADELFIIDKSY